MGIAAAVRVDSRWSTNATGSMKPTHCVQVRKSTGNSVRPPTRAPLMSPWFGVSKKNTAGTT